MTEMIMAVVGFAIGSLCVLGGIAMLWPDLYADLRERIFSEEEDDENT